MSEEFREVIAMLMTEGIDFTLEQGITHYYLIKKEGSMIVWELDDSNDNIYFYNEVGKRYTFSTLYTYVFAIQSAITRFHTYS